MRRARNPEEFYVHALTYAGAATTTQTGLANANAAASVATSAAASAAANATLCWELTGTVGDARLRVPVSSPTQKAPGLRFYLQFLKSQCTETSSLRQHMVGSVFCRTPSR